jgi:hypothetical protein
MGGELTESRFDPMTFGSDTMLNYQLFQKLKLIGRGKFNHLTITLTLGDVITPLWKSQPGRRGISYNNKEKLQNGEPVEELKDVPIGEHDIKE